MTVYTETARFDTGRSLTETEMRRLAPSIFAMSAHESRSECFKPIPTVEVLRGLAAEGFVAVDAKQSASRMEGKADFTKHLMGVTTIFGSLLNSAKNDCCGCELLILDSSCQPKKVAPIGSIQHAQYHKDPPGNCLFRSPRLNFNGLGVGIREHHHLEHQGCRRDADNASGE